MCCILHITSQTDKSLIHKKPLLPIFRKAESLAFVKSLGDVWILVYITVDHFLSSHTDRIFFDQGGVASLCQDLAR